MSDIFGVRIFFAFCRLAFLLHWT